MAFLALEKNRKRFPISVCARERSFEATFTEQRKQGRLYPGRAIETRRDSKTVSLKMSQFLPLLRQDLGQI